MGFSRLTRLNRYSTSGQASHSKHQRATVLSSNQPTALRTWPTNSLDALTGAGLCSCLDG